MSDLASIPGLGMGGDPLLSAILARGNAQEAEGNAAEKSFKESQAREAKARQVQADAMRPTQERERALLQQGAPAAPADAPLPDAPKAPKMDTEQMGNMLSLVAMLAGAGGRLTREPLTAALNDFAAGIEGMKAGQDARYQKSVKDFEMNVKKANTEHDRAWEKYKAASEKYGTDIQGLQNELKLIAAETQNPVDIELATRGDIVSLMKLHETQANNYTKVLESVSSMKASQAQHAETHRHNVEMENLGKRKVSNTEAIAAGNFTDDDVRYWAEVMQNGGDLPARLTFTPGGKKLVSDIMKSVAASGTSPSEMLVARAEQMGLKAAERTAGTRGANVEMAVNEAHNMEQIVESTSANFSRTSFMPINKALKSYEDNTGSTESRQFGAAVNSFINAYARAISPSGTPTVSDKEHAREMLSTADSHQQVVAVLRTLNQEMEAARASPGQVRSALRSGAAGKAAPAAAPLPEGWSVTEH